MIQATARAGTFVRVFEERVLRAVSFPRIVWLEATLERTSETSPVWCGHKDVLWLNKRNPFQEKKETKAAVVNDGVANPSPAPALNIFYTLIWKYVSPALMR